MDTESVNSAFTMADSDLEHVMGEFVWSDQRRMEFHPNLPLAAGQTYTVKIDTTASDLRGGKLSEPFQFSFTTECIEIERTTPGHNYTQVSTLTKVRISFNTDMDAESVNSAFKMVDTKLNNVAGEFQWVSLRSMEFRPSLPLAANETHTVTIDTIASGIHGTKLPQPYQFSFTTAPIVISSHPGDGDTRVPPVVIVYITFNTYMMPGSVTATFKMVDSEWQPVSGDFKWTSQYRMEFQPSSPLALNEQYTVAIDTTACDLHGVKLSEPHQFSFSTGPIELVSNPRNNETWISPQITVLIDFNTDMNAQSVNSAFKMVDSELNEVTGNHAWPWASRMEFRPHSALATSEKHTVTIDTSARDARGARLLEPYRFSFTTQPLLIVSTSPSNKQTWVSPFATIRIAFNTDMDMESVVSAFQMVDSEQNDVVGHFVWPDPGWLQFQPDPPLAPGETYTITIAASAADMYGKTLGAPYTFWFKTQP
jgi:predicted RNA-binding protein with TRAM domain